MPESFNFAHKLAAYLKNAKAAAGAAWDNECWLAAVNTFVNVERPLVVRTKRKIPLTRMNDEELMAELSSDPTYAGIEIAREFGKCRSWCKVNGKKPTVRRLLNWLNKADRTLTDAGASAAIRTALIQERSKTPPAGWKAFMVAKQKEWQAATPNGDNYEPPGSNARDFFGYPQSWRDACWQAQEKTNP